MRAAQPIRALWLLLICSNGQGNEKQVNKRQFAGRHVLLMLAVAPVIDPERCCTCIQELGTLSSKSRALVHK